MINETRIKEHFLGLVQIDSEAGNEAAVAEVLKRQLAELGASVAQDQAGRGINSNSGNIVATLPGTIAGAPPLLLCAHMDTVVPGNGVKPVLEGSIIHSDGTTILGGDDKSGIAIIFEAIRSAREQRIPTGDLEVVFTICEEKGLQGARAMDTTTLRSKFGLVFDSDEPGVLFTKAPAANHLEWRITGRAAHAGVAPERGLSAIRVASEAIAQMRLGRIDFETTANIGIIRGGAATNIIPAEVVVHGECRSRDAGKLAAQTQHMLQCFQDAAGRHAVALEDVTVTATIDPTVIEAYGPMNVADDAPIVHLVLAAGREVGSPVPIKAMG
ncbi:MAG: M20/M25/M40 family metallo-hydrolase, partial [Chloroflexota bacterium]